MDSLLDLLLILIAVLHFLFLVLEMFLWTKPTGRKVFGMKQERADSTKTLAANQGLYNGFLAAGLVWAVISGQFSIQLFF